MLTRRMRRSNETFSNLMYDAPAVDNAVDNDRFSSKFHVQFISLCIIERCYVETKCLYLEHSTKAEDCTVEFSFGDL